MDEFIGIYTKESSDTVQVYENIINIVENFKNNNNSFVGGKHLNKIDILNLYYEQKYLIYKNKYLNLKK